MGVAFSGIAIAQVTGYEGRTGITTEKPFATLDIEKNPASKLNGILIPRVTKAEAETMGQNTGGLATDALKESTLVYINDTANGTGTTYTSKVDAKGFYYFDGKEWVKVGGGAATSSTQNWEDIRYGTKGNETVTVTDTTISTATWFVKAEEAVTRIKLPTLTTSDAGRMITVFKEGAGNLTVLDANGVTAGTSGALIKGSTTITSSRGKIYLWDGEYWYPLGY